MHHHRKRRISRYPTNRRNYQSRDNGADKMRLSSNGFANDRNRGKFKPHQSADKLVEKYNALAKEALSSGDRLSLIHI